MSQLVRGDTHGRCRRGARMLQKLVSSRTWTEKVCNGGRRGGLDAASIGMHQQGSSIHATSTSAVFIGRVSSSHYETVPSI